jgi:hypothetical protein
MLDININCIYKQFYDKFIGNPFPNTCIIMVHQPTISKMEWDHRIPLTVSDLYYCGTTRSGLFLENFCTWVNGRLYGSHRQNGLLHFVNPVPRSSSWWTVSTSLYTSLDNSDIIYKPLQTTFTFRMTNYPGVFVWKIGVKLCLSVCLIFSEFTNSEMVSSNLSLCWHYISYYFKII